MPEKTKRRHQETDPKNAINNERHFMNLPSQSLATLTAISLLLQPLSPAIAMMGGDFFSETPPHRLYPRIPVPNTNSNFLEKKEEPSSSERASISSSLDEDFSASQGFKDDRTDNNNTQSFSQRGKENESVPLLTRPTHTLSVVEDSMDGVIEDKEALKMWPLLEGELQAFHDLIRKALQIRYDTLSPLLKGLRVFLENSPEDKQLVKERLPSLVDETLSLQPHTFMWGAGREDFTSNENPTIEDPYFRPLKSHIEALQQLAHAVRVKNKNSSSVLEEDLTKLIKVYEDYAKTLCEKPLSERSAYLSALPLKTERLDQKSQPVISREMAHGMLSINEYGIMEKPNITGSSSVSSLKGVHFKKNLLRLHQREGGLTRAEGTLDPAMEWAMYAFHKLLLGGGVPPSALLILPQVPQKEPLEGSEAEKLMKDILNQNTSTREKERLQGKLFGNAEFFSQFKDTTKAYAVQASRSIEGEMLGEFIEKAKTSPSLWEEVNLENFSGMVMAALLTSPVDGKPDNYIITSSLPRKIICIDNDLSLGSFIIKAGDNHYLETQSILFCLKELMEKPFSLNMREKFLFLDPHAFLLTWLRALKRQDNFYNLLLKQEDFPLQTYSQLYLPLRLQAGTMKELLLRFTTLQEYLRQAKPQRHAKGPSHYDLLKAVSPITEAYYREVVKRKGSAMDAFNFFYIPPHMVLSSQEAGGEEDPRKEMKKEATQPMKVKESKKEQFEEKDQAQKEKLSFDMALLTK